MPEEKKTEKPITDEIATTAKDTDIFSGWINRLENPDPTLRTEAKGKGLKLYDEVDRDPHAGSVLQTRYLAVVGKEWDVVAAQSSKLKAQSRDEEIAGFVKETLKATNFEQSMQELLQAILYGFYTAEVMWKARNGDIGISKIRAKHPRRFSFTQERELRLLTPSNMIEGEELPDRKFILFTYGSSDNPYGKGLGQKLWWPVWFKKHGIKFWLVFLEKFGMPTAVGKYPPGTDPDQQQKLLDAIDAIQNETGVKIPDTMAIDLLEAGRQGKVTYESLCEYMDKQMSKAVLGQTATTEGTPGKLGNEQAQQEVRQDIIEADATLLCETLNESLIPWIVDFNFPGVNEYPKFTIRVEEEKDLKPLAERDKTLTTEIGLPVGKKYFYETYGIPEPEEGEETVGGRQEAAGDEQALPMFSEYAEESLEAELAIEKERQKFVGQYLAAFSAAEQDARAEALRQVVSMLESGGALSEQAFVDEVYGILDAAYSALDKAALREPLRDIYGFYRMKDLSAWAGKAPRVRFTWGTVDNRTLDFMERLDRFYLGKYIKNTDMQGPVWRFLREQYMEKGAGLFGRASEETIGEFRELFSDKLSELSDSQIRRICDTSVQRMRSYGNIQQLHEAYAEYARVVAVLDSKTSAICQDMHGKKILVATMHATMMKEIAMSPEEFEEYLKENTVSIERAEQGEALPPYHPNCRTRVVMEVEAE